MESGERTQEMQAQVLFMLTSHRSATVSLAIQTPQSEAASRMDLLGIAPWHGAVATPARGGRQSLVVCPLDRSQSTSSRPHSRSPGI